jgi:hypothetical protein
MKELETESQKRCNCNNIPKQRGKDFQFVVCPCCGEEAELCLHCGGYICCDNECWDFDLCVPDTSEDFMIQGK